MEIQLKIKLCVKMLFVITSDAMLGIFELDWRHMRKLYGNFIILVKNYVTGLSKV